MSKIYEVNIKYCFELNGVLKNLQDKNSVIKTIDSESYKILKENNIIADGMLPKLDNCFDALKNGVQKVAIGNLSMITEENENYTTITL